MFFLFESPLKKKNEGFEKKKTTGTDPCSFSFTQFIGQCQHVIFIAKINIMEKISIVK